MRTAHFEYKCRRCGAIELNPRLGLPDGDTKATIAIINAATGQHDQPQAPAMWSLHTCGPNECGFSDLIGFHITQE